MSAVRSLTWAMWQRNSRWLYVIAGIMTAYCGYVLTFGGSIQHPVIFPVASLIVIFSYLALTGIFMYQDSDVGVGGSAYPVHMFTLPVRTAPLVFIPMLMGTTVFLTTGLLISRVIHSAEHIPLYWPTMLGTTMLAMLQAIFWYPIGVQYSKLVLTLASIPVLFFIAGYALEKGMSEETVCGYLGAFIVAFYAIAYRGVVRARQGDSQMIRLKSRPQVEQKSKSFKSLSFSSSTSAQRWYEWRQQGMILPYLVLFLCIIFVLPMFAESTETVVRDLGPNKDGYYPMVSTFIETYVRLLVFLVPITALIVGCGARRTDIKHADRTFALFFGVRPMSDGALVAQKLRIALKSSFISWAIVLLLFVMLLFTSSGFYSSNSQTILPDRGSTFSVLMSVTTWRTALCVIVGLALLVAITWRNYAIGFWTELSGNTYLRYGYPLVLLATSFGGAAYLGSFHGVNVIQAYHMLRVTVCILVVVKIAAAVILVSKQLKSGIMTQATFMRGAVAYLFGTSAVLASSLLCTIGFRGALVQAQIYSPEQASIFVIGLTLLWTPIVRILLATEMLHRNRHRAT